MIIHNIDAHDPVIRVREQASIHKMSPPTQTSQKTRRRRRQDTTRDSLKTCPRKRPHRRFRGGPGGVAGLLAGNVVRFLSTFTLCVAASLAVDNDAKNVWSSLPFKKLYQFCARMVPRPPLSD